MRTRIITLLVALMFGSIISFAQSEHLKFKGVPMDGTLENFMLQMEKKGLVTDVIIGNNAIMKGEFAGYDNCDIYIYSANNSVYMINAIIHMTRSWSVLESCYYNLKDMLTTKYGYPYICTEEFKDQYSEISDMSKVDALLMDECTFSTVYKPDNGFINLRMGQTNNYKCHICIAYVDDKNDKKKQESVYDDL